MATPLQQQSLRRKVTYIALILVLFTVAWVWRENVVRAEADQLHLREESVGEVELTGSAVRLSLTGSRGLAVCLLWMAAIEKQKKNQWDELELLVNSVTKLQPHFITPWLFQSWNLSYNVAVKCDLTRDMYFYIARGMDLLSRGERKNRDQPDLRRAMGVYYQMKICTSDRKGTLQSLFGESLVPPNQRQRAHFFRPDSQGREEFDWVAFEQFCKENPRLVRRLREQVKLNTPQAIVQFLDDNRRVPSLWEDRDDGKEEFLPPDQRFPVLPPKHTALPPQLPFSDKEYDWESIVKDDFDAFQAAREWFGYSQEPVPASERVRVGGTEYVKPGYNEPIVDRTRQRVPRSPATMIFRNAPARAQSYVGERLADEGWFDEGWKITGWFKDDKFADGSPAIVGENRDWARHAWTKAHDMWRRYGEENGLVYSPEEISRLDAAAQKSRKVLNMGPDDFPKPLRPEDRNDPEMVESHAANEVLKWYRHYRQNVNFAHFYFRSQTEMKNDTIQARKALFEADRLRLAGRAQALDRYEKALAMWKKVFDENPEFRTDTQTQEDTYETQDTYLQLFLDSPRGRVLKHQLLAQAYLGQALSSEGIGCPLWSLARLARPQAVAAPSVEGPFDGVDAKGTPYISEQARIGVRNRKGLAAPTPTPTNAPRPL